MMFDDSPLTVPLAVAEYDESRLSVMDALCTISSCWVLGTVNGRFDPSTLVSEYEPATLAWLGPVRSLPHAPSSTIAPAERAVMAKRAVLSFIDVCIARSSKRLLGTRANTVPYAPHRALGTTSVEIRDGEGAQPIGVGDLTDARDPLAFDREREHHLRLPAHCPHRAGRTVHERESERASAAGESCRHRLRPHELRVCTHLHSGSIRAQHDAGVEQREQLREFSFTRREQERVDDAAPARGIGEAHIARTLHATAGAAGELSRRVPRAADDRRDLDKREIEE